MEGKTWVRNCGELIVGTSYSVSKISNGHTSSLLSFYI